MASIKTPLYFLEAITLDLLSIPGLFMGKKGNALWHLKVICPLCSKWRKSFRCAKGKHECMWYESWKKGNYGFPRSFGTRNWVRYYFGRKTELGTYKKEYAKTDRSGNKESPLN